MDPAVRLLLLACTILVHVVSLPQAAAAEDGASYNFAALQEASTIQAVPGRDPAIGVLYFYNVDGNRTTHISLRVTGKPAAWGVSIDPALHTAQYSMGEAVLDVEENCAVEPGVVSAEYITSVPEGMVCLPVPNKLGTGVTGYVLARRVFITIEVPKGVGVGTTGTVGISGTASWLGQTGAGTVALERDFTFTVQTVYEIGQERPVTNPGFDIGRWAPVLIAVGIVVVAAFVMPRFNAGRKRR